MISDEVTNYLDNKEKDIVKKYEFIKSLNLSYVDLYDLKQMYRHDENIYRILEGMCYSYCDCQLLETQLDKERRKIITRKKQKKLKFHKRSRYYD